MVGGMPKRRPIATLTVELAALRSDIREGVHAGYVTAVRMRDLGQSAAELVHGFFLNAPSRELIAVSAHLRAIALQAATLASELMATAARFEQIASVYDASGQHPEDV